jgi:hypothetical protein
VIVEHLDYQIYFLIENDKALLGIMPPCVGYIFGVYCAPLHEIRAWEFHGYVGLANEALEAADIDRCLNLCLLQ